jgi:23S rRNA (adenine2503-C2)-methyltransferase
MSTSDKLNIFNMDPQDLENFFIALGERSFRAVQIMKWIYHKHVIDFGTMSNISKLLQEQLAKFSELRLPEIVSERVSEDGCHKWLIRIDNGNCIETVFIPEIDRGTLCISSQIGCPIDCSFCATARQGFNRNLTTAEIIGQVWLATRSLGYTHGGNRIITNIVLMGMGEPLLNFHNVVKAIALIQNDLGFGISKRRITLSTAGVVPALYRLRDTSEVSLAVSLHAPDDKLRDKLVPLNRKYPISELLKACSYYIAGKPYRRITWEYVLLDGINDSVQHATALVALLKHIPSKINLIPFNPFPEARYRRSSPEAMDKFRDILTEHGLTTITRRTRGNDIAAACGQLAGEVQARGWKRHRFV